MRRNTYFSLSLALAAGTATIMSLTLPTSVAHAMQKKDKKGKKEAAEAPKFELGDEYRKKIVEVQELLAGTDNAASAVAVKELEALTQNEDEKYLTGQMYINLAAKTNDRALQKKGLEYSLGGNKLSQADRGLYTSILGEMALVDEKDPVKAEKLLLEAQQAGYKSPAVLYQLAESKFSQAIKASGGNTINQQNAATAQEGLKYLDEALAMPDPKNQLNKADLYKRGTSIASVTGSADATKWAAKYVKASPGPDSWNVVLSLLRQQASYGSQDNLDLMRLMRRTDALKTSNDYAEYSENAEPRALPGEVVAVLDEGKAKGIINPSEAFIKESYDSAKSRVSADRAGLGASEKSARSASGGKFAAATADAYLGYDNFDKAEELYALALSKGVEDQNRILTRLGIAQTDQGKYAQARETFAKVQGVRKPLADLWMLYVDQEDPQASPMAQPDVASEPEPAS